MGSVCYKTRVTLKTMENMFMLQIQIQMISISYFSETVKLSSKEKFRQNN